LVGEGRARAPAIRKESPVTSRTHPIPELKGAILIGLIGLQALVAAPRSHAAEESEESARPAEAQAAFVEGYVSGMLEQTHALHGFSIRFEAPVLDVELANDPTPPLDKLTRSLLALRGVERVRIRVDGRLVVDESLADARVDPAARSAPNPDALEEDAATGGGFEIFPDVELFAPLLADPRWPRFSASYQQYLDDDELSGVGAASFGETFPLVRSPQRAWGRFEIAFQAGVFSVFDLDADSSDLVNSDFMAGFSASHHLGDFTTMFRIYHQSSHLGDEFLLRTRVDRVNLSFEVLDGLVSFAPWRWLRLYGGGGFLFDREPDLDRGLLQAGIELAGPTALALGYLRPIAALDVQSREESDWRPDFSLRAGLQLEHPSLEDRRLRLLGEFYDGRSPNGQFYERDIQTIGIGLSLGF